MKKTQEQERTIDAEGDALMRVLGVIEPYAEDAIILTLTLGALAYVSTLAIPFALAWAMSYMLVRTLFDTLRRAGGRWAVLAGVALIAIALTLVHARDWGMEARVMDAMAKWREADARASAMCAGNRVGTPACVDALTQEREAAYRLCDVSGGRYCP